MTSREVEQSIAQSYINMHSSRSPAARVRWALTLMRDISELLLQTNGEHRDAEYYRDLYLHAIHIALCPIGLKRAVLQRDVTKQLLDQAAISSSLAEPFIVGPINKGGRSQSKDGKGGPPDVERMRRRRVDG